MQIKNSFEVPLPPDEAWAILMDVPRIAPCVPGAELTGRTDDSGYNGKVSVRLGPVALSFNGVAHIVEQDDTAKQARIEAAGDDQKGRGAASAVLTFNLSATESGSRADIVTDVMLTGPVAQYGRATGVIQTVATQIINQFSANLRQQIDKGDAAPSGAATSGGTGSTISEYQGSSDNAIGGFSLIFAILKGKLRDLFSGRK